jgi:hypothetical protein
MSAVEEARAGRHAEAMQLLKRVIAAYDGYHMQDLQLAFKLSRHLVRVDSDAEQQKRSSLQNKGTPDEKEPLYILK